MKTLVIHPYNANTEFMINIYKDKNWDIIRSSSSDFLKLSIPKYDRILMLGTGSRYGLSSSSRYNQIIDSSMVSLLRNKVCIGLWNNAHLFFKKYKMYGLCLGPFIFRTVDAHEYRIPPNIEKLIESNNLLSVCLNKFIDENDFIYGIKNIYNLDTNPIVEFNKKNIYYYENH